MKASRGLLYATATLLPLYPLRLHAGSAGVRVVELAVLLTAVVFAVESRITSVRPRWPGAYTGPMLCLAASLVLSLATAPDWRNPATGVRSLFLEPAALLGIGVAVLDGPAQLRRLCSAILVGGAALAVAELVAVVRAVVAAGGVSTTPPLVRLDGVDGFLLVPLTGLALALLLGDQAERKIGHRVIPGAYLLVALPATLLALDRDAWFVTAIVALVVASTHVSRRLLVCGAVIAACSALLALPMGAGLPALPRATPAPAFAAVPLWAEAAHTLAAATGRPAGQLSAAGVETGLVGLLGLWWLGWRMLRWEYAVLRLGDRRLQTYAVASGAMLTGVLLRGLLNDRGLVDDLAAVAMLAAALLATVARLERMRLRSLIRLRGMAVDIEPAELPMPSDIPRRTGRYAPPGAVPGSHRR